ncbi:blastoderm-specific protein 25D isoform X2 [Daktulosphaira vitifoliae]|uniref:blastoderm-specific protein 25D isoform X2 n=1 Tax=Daktulosphaira vitifoliae TaxID=58002 RepID=UPI0021AA0A6F|nr:blastoderm-specific protein 25D isoform X2 [Daktulosphaira vitifoliae]
MEEPYERELYNLFKSFEHNDNGLLDHNGINSLCETLQLDSNQKKQIWSYLDQNQSISFQQFRDALIFLANNDLREMNKKRESSPGREISPIYVSGAKKYGRRSKPRHDSFILSPPSSFYGNTNNCLTANSQHVENENFQLNYEPIDDIQNKANTLFHCDDKSNLSIDKHSLSVACEHLDISNGFISKNQLFIITQRLNNNEKFVEKINEKYINDDIPIKDVLDLINNLDSRSMSPDSETSTSGISSTSFYNNGDNIQESMFLNVYSVLELWDNCGITEPITLLHHLGINTSTDSILNISELIFNINTEVNQIQNSLNMSTLPNYDLMHSAFFYIKALNSLNEYHIKRLKVVIEQVNCEKDKLKFDVETANDRAAMLAQEVDENHMRLEKSSLEKINALEQKQNEEKKSLMNQWFTEKDNLFSQINILNENLKEIQNYKSELQLELVKTKEKVGKLEKENSKLQEQLEDTINKNTILEVYVQEIPKLKLKEIELESSNVEIMELMEKIDYLKNENKNLRDQNDELAIELESVKGSNNQNLNESFESNMRNFLAEKNSPNCFGKINIFSSSNNFIEESIDSPNNIETNIESDVTLNRDDLTTCSEEKTTSISSTLINSLKSKISQSDMNVEQLDELISYFKIKKQKLQSTDNFNGSSISCCHSSSPTTKNFTRRSLIKQFENSLDSETVQNKINDVEKLKNLYEECKSENDILHLRCEQITKDWELRYNDLEEVADKALDEAKKLKDECADLESGMDDLRNEYFECEEYWSMKLDEERSLNEKEKKVYEHKLNNLEAKIKEFSDLTKKNNEKLSPIIENAELEEQINCLQKDFMEYQTQTKEKLTNLLEENKELKSKVAPMIKKIDREVSASILFEECEKCKENNKECHELKNKYSSVKTTCEKLTKECRALLQKRSGLLNEISKLQQYFINLSNNQLPRQDIYYSNQLTADAKKCKELEQKILIEQTRHQKFTDAIWKEHQMKIDEVHKIIRSLQDKLEEQMKLKNEKTKHLRNADMIVKELFIENAKLKSIVHNIQIKIDKGTYNSM